MNEENITSLADIINNIYSIVGDTPVSEQLSIALSQMSKKSHIHENYVSIEQYNDLEKKVNELLALVGDTPVSEQIDTAIKNIK